MILKQCFRPSQLLSHGILSDMKNLKSGGIHDYFNPQLGAPKMAVLINYTNVIVGTVQGMEFSF